MTDRMTSAELAAYLGVGIAKARHLMGGEIPAAFLGRSWTAARSDVDSWLEAKSTTGKHRRAKGQRGRGKSLGAPPSRGSTA